MTQFMKSMQQTEVKDNVLKLKNRFPWMNGPTIYVREVYERLHDLISRAPRDVVVTGTPGIGKSYYAVYELYLAVRDDKNVVYQRGDKALCFEANAGCAFVCDVRSSIITNLLLEETTVFLYDCCTREPVKNHLIRKARVVVVSSPHEPNYKDIIKNPGTEKYYMHVWSLDELASCYANVYAKDGDKYVGWEDKYAKFGGIPRYTFTHPNEAKHHLKHLNDCCTSCTPEMLIDKYMNHVSADVSHMIFKLQVPQTDVTLTDVTLDFASDYVEDLVFETMKKSKRDMRLHFISRAINISCFAGLSGRLFEVEAHKILCQGGSFALKHLNTKNQTKNQTSVMLSETKPTTFQSLSEVDLSSSEKYWKPLAKNFPTIDALTGPGVLFQSSFKMSEVDAIAYQMTISKRHSIKLSGLHRLKERGIKNLLLVFVVPKEIFAVFGEQCLEGTPPLTVDQHALCLDIDDYVNKCY